MTAASGGGRALENRGGAYEGRGGNMTGVYLFSITGYICLLWLVGAYATRKSLSSEAYLVAGRGLSVPFIAVLVAGAWIGGVSVVGMAQGAYIHGISALWFQAGIWVAMCVTAAILPRIMRNRKTYSILDVVENLYDSRTAGLAGLLQLVFSLWVITMQIVGGGAILSFILGDRISFREGMALTAVVFTLYNVAGGFVATAYTNMIHICAIFLGIFLGGLWVIIDRAALAQMVGNSHFFKPFGDLGAGQALSWAYINLTLGVLAQPIINTASSARSLSEGRRGILIGNFIAIPVVIMAALCGIAAKGLFPSIPSLTALPQLLPLMPPVVAVLFLLGMWAPLMSSGSPFLMGATTLVVRGYIVPVCKMQNDRRLLLASRITTVAIGAFSLILGLFVKEILREVTWLAVFLSAVVYIVCAGWISGRIPGVFASASLLCAVVIVACSFLFGFYRFIHPIWPVTACVAMVLGAGLFRPDRARRDGSEKT
jgi:solute:Na+ symporter, SSS family